MRQITLIISLLFPILSFAQNDIYNTRLDTLEATTVTARKNKLIYKVDKTVLSGDSNSTASGRTAADILSSLPSLRIDSQGDISFRG
ncbi:MAG: hypothetical protein HUJ94_02310, partial [Bacteroidales bacterium]|nr:hypothetical protein [Bacteroidales bacterium]